MSERKGCFGTGLNVVLGLALLIVVPFTLFSLVASAHLNRKLDDLRTRGVKLKVSELAPPAAPPDRNAALVYQQAFDALQLSNDDETAISDMLKPVREGEPSPPLPADTIPRARAALQKNAPALALVHQASLMPECTFPVNWDAGPGAAFPHYAKLRKVARMLGAAAVFAAGDGNPRAAAEYLLDGVRAGEAPTRDPTLIGYLVHVAIDAIIERATCEALRTVSLPPADCRRLAERYAASDEMAMLSLALEGERASGVTFYEIVRRHRMAPPRTSDATDDPSYLLGNPVLRPLLSLDEAFYLDLMDEQTARAKLPFTEAHKTPFNIEDRLKGKPYILARMLIPMLSRATSKRDQCLAGLGMAQAALGLQAWKTMHGSYPASLADLKTKLDWRLRPDPYSDQNLIYRPQGGTFLLYSVGQNQKDDEGKVAAKDYFGEEGDIVWGKSPATK